ncbi:thioesterase family protein [Pelomonas sp. KK5]|uniref:acyl-CoA thioesterase n=1 Tax=Pelomonas sp. KK5 TaxID=1855730 RepID=UPI00097C8195|nr:thioesterase family protein [Pelomonas sp. KK5]
MKIAFQREQRVRFGHCDPAGIVYYPRYFEMLHEVMEDWFNLGLKVDYATLLGPRRTGMPTIQLKTDFKRISRMGDVLAQRIEIQKLGRTSLVLKVEFHGDDGLRAAFEQVLVCTSLETHQPIPFPDDLRAALELCTHE